MEKSFARRTFKKGLIAMAEYITIFTPYITRGGKRIWASQYGLKAFCLKIPKEKYRG